MRIDDHRVVPFRRAQVAQSPSRTVHIDIEIDLIRQCREDWRRGETEIWRHLSLEADLCRDVLGRLCLYGLPGHDGGVIVPTADDTQSITRFEEPGLCVAMPSAAIRDAEAALQPATIVLLPLRRAS